MGIKPFGFHFVKPLKMVENKEIVTLKKIIL